MTCGRPRGCARRSPPPRWRGGEGPSPRPGRRSIGASRPRSTGRSPAPSPAQATSLRCSTRRAARIGATTGRPSPCRCSVQRSRGQRHAARGRVRTCARACPPTWTAASLHDYLGFRLFQTELAAGDAADAVAGLYAGARPHHRHRRRLGDGHRALRRPRLGHQPRPARDVRRGIRGAAAQHAGGGQRPPAACICSPARAPRGWRRGSTSRSPRRPPTTASISFTERSTRRGETLTWHEHAGCRYTAELGAAGVGAATRAPRAGR